MNHISEVRGNRTEGLFELNKATNSVIAFVSRNQTFSERLCRVTESELNSARVKRFDTVPEVVDMLHRWHEHLRLVILDESAAAQLDINLAEWMRAQSGVIFACAYTDPEKVRKLMCSRVYPDGVSSLFPVNMNFDSWISMLKLCLAGHAYVTPELISLFGVVPNEAANNGSADPIMAQPKPQEDKGAGVRPLLERLTCRERQVLELVTQGHQNKIIATMLTLSENTVKLHIHHIISKLGVHNRTEAAIIYAKSNT